MGFRHRICAAGFGVLAATGADRWLRFFARGRRETAGTKALLEQRLGRPVRHLAYPFGDRSTISAEFGIARQAGLSSP